MTQKTLMQLAEKLWSLNRSLIAEGNLETLKLIENYVGVNLEHTRFPSGSKVQDWEIPQEWLVRDAFIIDPAGRKILDFKENNLHLLSYSTAVKLVLPLEELQKYLISLPEQPDAIPYATSYYSRTWGFCISHNERVKLKPGNYEVVIDTVHKDGHLYCSEFYFPGSSSQEIFLSTYICHPSMANDNLSGPVVAAEVARILAKDYLVNPRRLSLRIVFLPETIGSIALISHNLISMKKNVIAGYVLTCVGDEREWSFLPSRNSKTIADKVALRVLKANSTSFKIYDWKSRGSDERQYCSPGVDLPFASIMRSKYGTYPEYHTSNDKLGSVVTEKGLQESVAMYLDVIEALENYSAPVATHMCEPNMSKRNLYPTMSKKNAWTDTRNLMTVLSYCDGENDCLDIASLVGLTPEEVNKCLVTLKAHDLIRFS
jgi:aminopeptidase-like protein